MSRTESPRKTKIGTEVAHVTRDSDTTFKVKNVKGQGHQAALLTTALTSQAAAALSVGTYWPWEPNGTLRSALCRHGWLGSARRFGTHTGRRGAGHVVAAARLYSLLSFVIIIVMQAVFARRRITVRRAMFVSQSCSFFSLFVRSPAVVKVRGLGGGAHPPPCAHLSLLL